MMKPNPIDEMLGLPAGAGLLYLDIKMSGLTPAQAIENQERNGQAEAIYGSKLPIDGTLENRDKWEALGFIFGEDEDELFVHVQMPQGWKLIKDPESDCRHSLLLDEQERIRGRMFYKAAFYDMKASIFLKRRFTINRYASGNSDTMLVTVLDNSVTPPTVIMQSAEIELPNDVSRFETEQKMIDTMEAKLIELYPDYDNPVAYW